MPTQRVEVVRPLLLAGLFLCSGCIARASPEPVDTGVSDTVAPEAGPDVSGDTTPPEDTGVPPEDTGTPPEDTGVVVPEDVFRCPMGQTDCGGMCRDLQGDREHCGTCGNACPTGQMCVTGTCLTVCPTGQTDCGGMCRDLQGDRENCGSCGTVCPAMQSCVVGACRLICPSGQSNCSGVCRDLLADVANCGACGNACPTGQMCNAGSCVLTCTGGLTNCFGVCRNLLTDALHCGLCGNVCPAGQSCVAGACLVLCSGGLTSCSGVCRNLLTDTANCGACGNTCPTGQTCSSGSCVLTCSGGLTNCSGVCRNLLTDNANCGACGNACPTGQTCSGGSCVVTCSGGLTNCSGVCRNLLTDTANCGACGNACPSGQTCTGGTCSGGSGSGFQITALTAAGCLVVDHNSVTSDDRGGIAVSTSQVFYSGDGATGRFALGDLSGGTSVGRVYDGLVGNLRTGTVYTLAHGGTPLAMGSGVTTVSQLLEINGATGALTGASITLSPAVTIPAPGYGSTVGLFSGYDRIVIFTGSRAYEIALPAGAVTDRGAMSIPTHAYCENWAFWGVAESFGGALYVDYVQSSTAIVRTRVPDGATTTIGTFTNLSDMCSFTVSIPTGRWYFHHEYSGQFGGSSETVGYCTATLSGGMPPSGSYTRGTPPGSVVWIDACAAPGHLTFVPSVDDSHASTPLPFSFRYWGTTYAAGTGVNVTSNGFFSLDGSGSHLYYGDTLNIPNATAPNAVVALSWRDLATRAGGVCVATTGSAPNRQFVVEWNDAYDLADSSSHQTFEAILHETTNVIDFLYQTMTGADARPRTVGLENPDGTQADTICTWGDGYTTASCSAVASGTRLRFTPTF